MKKLIFLFCALIFLGSASWQGVEKIGLKMTKRVNRNNVTQTIVSKVYYSLDGTMVTYYPSPNELYMVNNSRGELKIYNPEKNEVFQSINFALSSDNSNVYYFFQGKSEDMGLSKLGFKLGKSKLDGDLLVSTWSSPVELQKNFSNIELVNRESKPIFLGYLDRKGNYIKKVYFYDFTAIRNVDIPQSITEIDYLEGDSIISKTTLSDFVLEGEELDRFLNFKIPTTAKLIE